MNSGGETGTAGQGGWECHLFRSLAGSRSSIVVNSPFSQILGPYQDKLPEFLLEQYLCPADADYEIVLGGQMQTIWRRPAWLYPVFWLLSKWDLFFPETGQNIPATLIISPGRNPAGEAIQVWERSFFFPNRVRRRYRSTMLYDSRSRMVVELQGRNNIFEEVAKIEICPPDTLEFQTVASVLRLGRLRIPLPKKLWITAHVVHRATEPEKSESSVRLTITHGLLGAVFGYEGRFRAKRRSRHDQFGA